MKKLKVPIIIFYIVLIITVGLNELFEVPGMSGREDEGIIIHWVRSVFVSDNYKHYSKSATYSREAVDIIRKHSVKILEDGSDEIVNERTQAIDLLKKAISEAEHVEDSYLSEIHPYLKEIYRGQFLKSQKLLLKSLETRDISTLTYAVPIYNEFISSYDKHQNEFEDIK